MNAGKVLSNCALSHFGDESRLDEVSQWVGERLPGIVDLHKRLILDGFQSQVLGPPLSNLRRLGFLSWSQWQALAFQFAERDRNAPRRFASSVAALERWCFCINLLDVSDDLVTDSVIRALNQSDPFARDGALRLSKSWRERVRARLHDGQMTDDERRGAHVRWMETRLWPDAAVNFAATNDASVEHVLPRRASEQWLIDFPESTLIHTELFGNLCLVPKRVNDAIGRQQYPEKRAAYLSLPQQYKSAHDVASTEQWTMAAVHARTERLEKIGIDALGVAERPHARPASGN